MDIKPQPNSPQKQLSQKIKTPTNNEFDEKKMNSQESRQSGSQRKPVLALKSQASNSQSIKSPEKAAPAEEETVLGKRDADGNLARSGGDRSGNDDSNESQRDEKGDASDNDGSNDDQDDDDQESSQNDATTKLKSRGIGVTRDRRLKTIQQTAAANEAAQANAMAQNERAKANANKSTEVVGKKAKKKDREVQQGAPNPQQKDTFVLSSQPHSSSAATRKFLYKPFVFLPDLTDFISKTVEVRVHKVYLTKFNKAVQFRQFFGNDFYSSDSDIVCILQHQGAINLTDQEPAYEGISVFFKVAKGKHTYQSQYKNGIKSQKKKIHYEGNSIRFDSCKRLQNFGGDEELKSMAELMPNKIENVMPLKRMIKQNQKKKIMVSKLADIAKKAVWPALIYNLCNEPAFKFSLCVFGDKSSDIQSRSSYFTRKQAIYLETETDRYEICRNQPSVRDEDDLTITRPARYTFSKVMDPQILDNQFFASSDIPLSTDNKEIIADDLHWEDFIWSDFQLEVNARIYSPLHNFKLYDITQT